MFGSSKPQLVTNYSDREEAATAIFVKAKQDLEQLQSDINSDIAATEQHLAKLKNRAASVSKSIKSLEDFVG